MHVSRRDFGCVHAIHIRNQGRKVDERGRARETELRNTRI